MENNFKITSHEKWCDQTITQCIIDLNSANSRILHPITDKNITINNSPVNIGNVYGNVYINGK